MHTARTASLDAARQFVRSEGRLLERRLVAARFDGAGASGVLAALAAYRNDDGGFGEGLEPDSRAPMSQPLAVEVAFQTMAAAGQVDEGLVAGACDFLASIGPGVGCLVPAALEYPRAPHWAAWAVDPSLNPTAGLAAHLWVWGVDHPWRAAATDFCWAALERELPDDAHGVAEVLAFLDAVPDADRAASVVREISRRLPHLALFRLDAGAPGYGLTPLHLAPSPQSRWLTLFDGATVDAHLDALAAAQGEDGGWPISWETVGPAACQEWRGVETVRAMRTLHAFGRLV